MLNPKQCVLYSGGAAGTEQFFGALAEGWGIEEVNYSFEGHQIERKRGVRVLTSEELALKDVSLTYVSKLMNREYTRAPIFRKVLQSICWQVSSGNQVIVIGAIQPDNTVKGGTGWGAEFAKICNKPLLVFDQPKNGWFTWDKEVWTRWKSPSSSMPTLPLRAPASWKTTAATPSRTSSPAPSTVKPRAAQAAGPFRAHPPRFHRRGVLRPVRNPWPSNSPKQNVPSCVSCRPTCPTP